MPNLNDELNKQAELFVDAVKTKANTFLVEVANFANKQAAMGVTDEQIVANLQEQIETKTGVFKVLQDEVSKIMGQSVSMVSGGVFNTAVANKNRGRDLREWITVYSGNESTKHCDTCLDRHKDVKTLIEWQQIGTPDNPFFDVHLSYGVPCYCILLPIDISSAVDDLLEPIQLG